MDTIVVSAGHMGGTRGSGVMSSAADVLWMSVVHGMRGVGGVCEMCMGLSRGGVGVEGGEWMRGLSLETRGSVGRVSVCGVRWCGWRRWGVEWRLDQGLEGWGGVMFV